MIGLRFAHPMGGMFMTRACYDAGIWAMFAGFDRSVLQFKPGLLMSDAEAARRWPGSGPRSLGSSAPGSSTTPDMVARMFGQMAQSHSGRRETQKGTPDDGGHPRPTGRTGSKRPSTDATPPPPPSPTATACATVLTDTEAARPANPEAGGHVKVLAYGEISAALTTDELPGLVCKRMAGYPDEESVNAYLDLVDEYLAELTTAGVRVVPTEAIPVHRPDSPPVVYLVQPRMDSQTLGHRLLHTTDDAGLAT